MLKDALFFFWKHHLVAKAQKYYLVIGIVDIS